MRLTTRTNTLLSQLFVTIVRPAYSRVQPKGSEASAAIKEKKLKESSIAYGTKEGGIVLYSSISFYCLRRVIIILFFMSLFHAPGRGYSLG